MNEDQIKSYKQAMDKIAPDAELNARVMESIRLKVICNKAMQREATYRSTTPVRGGIRLMPSYDDVPAARDIYGLNKRPSNGLTPPFESKAPTFSGKPAATLAASVILAIGLLMAGV
jgi:hypothetical protein